MIKYLFIVLLLAIPAPSYAGSAYAGAQAACSREIGTDTYIIAKLKEKLEESGIKDKTEIYDAISAQVNWAQVPEKEAEPLRLMIKRGVDWPGDMYAWFMAEKAICVKRKTTEQEM